VSSSHSSGGGGGGSSIEAGAYADLPAAGEDGRVYYCTDAPYVLRDNGVTWLALAHGYPVTVPPSAGWSWVNQQVGDTIVATRGVQQLLLVSRAANVFTLRARAAPATPYTLTAGFRMVQWAPGAIWLGGIGWRQSSDGKFILVGMSNAGAVGSSDWINPTTFSDNNGFFSAGAFFRGPEWWIQIADDGTNRKTRYGLTPLDFTEFQSEGRTTFLTADEVFFGGQGDGGEDSRIDLVHFAIT
jgi:hypothetical protein